MNGFEYGKSGKGKKQRASIENGLSDGDGSGSGGSGGDGDGSSIGVDIENDLLRFSLVGCARAGW